MERRHWLFCTANDPAEAGELAIWLLELLSLA
jgi:hypothetical protein